MEPKWPPKGPKQRQKGAKGAPNSRKCRKKGMPKTKPEIVAKRDATRFWHGKPGGMRVASLSLRLPIGEPYMPL